jgi:tetratricopeptide (TPR) repeat protein
MARISSWLTLLQPQNDDFDGYQIQVRGLTAGRSPWMSLVDWQTRLNFVPLETTQHLLTCYGWALLQSGRKSQTHLDEASRAFRQAIELDSHSWKALQGLSNCLAKTHEYEEASAILEKAVKELPACFNSELFDLQCNLTDYLLDSRDFKSALTHAKYVHSANPQNHVATARYIMALFAEQKFEKIVDVVELMDCSSLGILFSLRDAHFEIGCALRDQGRLDMFSQLLSAAPLPNQFLLRAPWLAAWKAEFKYYFATEIDGSLADFEEMRSPEFKLRLGQEFWQYHDYLTESALEFLPKIYFQKAVDSRKCGNDPTEWVNKLRDLATSTTTEADIEDDFYEPSAASKLLGLYLRHYQRAERSIWSPYFQRSIQKALDMIEVGEKVEACYPYGTVAKFLLLAGDIHNAAAAFAVNFLPWTLIGDDTALSVREEIGLGTQWICDGYCSSELPILRVRRDGPYEELHFCQICEAVCFCERCLPLLKSGKLPFRVCSPDHEFLQVYPIPESAKDVAARFVDRKAVEVRKQWLEGLREEWN